MNKSGNRELRISKILSAPIEQVWEVWTNPNHIANWWGPNGFTNTIHKMDFQEGGEWILTMHGPDGTNYPNKSVFKEIIPLKKIVFEHFNPHFITTVQFESNGQNTLLNWSMVFDTSEMLETVVKAHKADEGLKQNIEKLENYLRQHGNQQNVIVEHAFNADRPLVWRAITEKEMMKQWYFDFTEFKAVVGFKFEFMGGEDGGKQWKHLCEITEVVPESKLTYSWKYEGCTGISYVTFELFDENENTRLKLTHSGIATFPADVPELAIHNFEQGWNHIINISLKEFLEKNNH